MYIISKREVLYHPKISAPTHHKKNKSIEVMEMWQRRVTKLYSTTSKRNHMTVIPIKCVADTVLFFHNNKSATANPIPIYPGHDKW
jgi:hypothetical protein